MDFKIPLYVNTNLPVTNGSPKSTPAIKRNHLVSRKNSRSPIVHRVSIDTDTKTNSPKSKAIKKI